MSSIIALTIACLIPLAFLYGIRGLDFYKTGNIRYNLISIGWGVVAYELAVVLNTSLISHGIVSRDQLVRFAAPAIEEILKGLILIYLVSRTDFRYFVDGAIYGFGAGIGFAIIENFEYVLGHPQTALLVAISRVLSTNLIHATGSAMIGIAFGRSRFALSMSWKRGLSIAAGLVLAIGLHTGFNNMASSGLLLGYAIAAGMGAAAFIGYAIKQGLREEKVWIDGNLGEEDRVTAGEVAIVKRLDKSNRYLAPIAERFGPATASQCEQFLTKQAHLGIIRKSMEEFRKSGNEQMRLANEADIVQTAAEMDALRRKVGAYAMLYLRNIFPENNSPVWGLINERVTAASSGPAGSGVWANLDQRMKKSTQENPE